MTSDDHSLKFAYRNEPRFYSDTADRRHSTAFRDGLKRVQNRAVEPWISRGDGQCAGVPRLRLGTRHQLGRGPLRAFQWDLHVR